MRSIQRLTEIIDSLNADAPGVRFSDCIILSGFVNSIMKDYYCTESLEHSLRRLAQDKSSTDHIRSLAADAAAVLARGHNRWVREYRKYG